MTVGRSELAACPDYLRAGETLVVPSLDRLSRSLQDLITIVAGLRRRGTGFRSRHQALDTTTRAAGWSSASTRPWPSSSRGLIVEGFALCGATTGQHDQAAALLA